MSPAAQPVISFRASVSPPLVTCPQHPSPDTLDRAWVQVPPVPSHVSNHMPGPAGPSSLSPTMPTRQKCGRCLRVCKSVWIPVPSRAQEELLLMGHGPCSPRSVFARVPCSPCQEGQLCLFKSLSDSCTPFQVSVHVPASSPQSLRSPPTHHSEILLTSSTFP